MFLVDDSYDLVESRRTPYRDPSTQFEESTGAPDTTMESAVYVYKGKTEQGDAPKDIQKATVASQVHIIFAESFQDCTLLVSVILPLGLRVIEEHAFANCTSLKTIPIPSSVCIIHYGAFMTCEGLETMDLPEGLTEVTDQTFEGCSSLRHAHIPSTVLYVGGQAFMGCGQLRDMDLPYGLHQIGSTAFGSCRSLERILIPSTVVAIGGRIFSECTALKSVEIGTDSGLQVIGPDAFKDCAQLMNVVIPSNCKVYSGVPEGFSIRRHASVDQPQLTNDATRAFHGAADTTPDSTMYIYQIEDDAVSQEIERVIVEARIQIIRPEVFNACQLLVSVGFPMGLKVIMEEAFEYCTALKTISIPSSVKIIFHSAFFQCEALETVVLPEGLTKIYPMTFARCESLRDINIPSTVLYVGARAFDDCHELPYVDLPRGLLQIGESAFNGCRSLERILIPSTVVAIGPAAFHVCSSLRSVEISIAQNGHGVLEAIGPDAFMHCSSLTNIGIPNNCNVGSGAFPASARCCHKFFEMFIDGRMKDLPKRLKGRFDSLPYHTICYQQGHAGEMATEFTPIVQDYERGSERIKDIFGLTPFHILALSAKPSIAALKMLVEETSMSANGILEFDEWEGYYTQTLTPLRYAIENRAPEALAFIKAMLHVLVDQRTTDLGLELWRSDIVRAINSFEGRDGSERAENVHDLFELLRLYERKEAISLLEQAVWKQRIAQTDRSNEDDDRQGYYLKSGAEIVIPNILPYLGSIEKTLMF